MIFIAGSVTAQQQLQYDIHVDADLPSQQFDVNAALTFLTDAQTRDSFTVLIGAGGAVPQIEMKDLAATMQISASPSGDSAYTFRFQRAMPVGTTVKLDTKYRRGTATAFQFFIDSNFCMAGGYGTAWYPEVITRDSSGDEHLTRGTGRLVINTNQGISAVMASCDIRARDSTGKTITACTYKTADIFSLYIGKYNREIVNSHMPFYTYRFTDGIDGKELSRRSADVLNYLTTQFGPLTLTSFSIIEFPNYVADRTGIGGASLAGAIVMPTSSLRTFNYALFGHEIGHQWWGNKIISKGVRGSGMLSEGMAQYGSLKVVEHFDSTHATNYRKTGYPGYLLDQSGFGYLKLVASGSDQPLSQLSGSNTHAIGDSKGFLVMDLLSATVGRATFNKAMREIGNRYKNGLSWNEFLDMISKTYGKDLTWFYRQWFDRTGVPRWSSDWKQNGNTLHISITQKDTAYKLPLDLLLKFENGKTQLKKVFVSDLPFDTSLTVAGKISTVIIDPYFKVIHWDDSLTAPALGLGKAQQVLNLRMQGKNDEAIALGNQYLEEGIPDDNFGAEFDILYYLGRVYTTENKPDAGLDSYRKALQCVSRDKELLAYTYFRIAEIASKQKNSILIKWACKNAVLADSLNHGNDNMTEKIKDLEK